MKKGSGISACCKGRYHFAGKDDNGIPLVWRYLSDYKNMNQDEIFISIIIPVYNAFLCSSLL